MLYLTTWSISLSRWTKISMLQNPHHPHFCCPSQHPHHSLQLPNLHKQVDKSGIIDFLLATRMLIQSQSLCHRPMRKMSNQLQSYHACLRLIVRNRLWTATNSFGLLREYLYRPSFNPDSFVPKSIVIEF